jgi:hypothetical protein
MAEEIAIMIVLIGISASVCWIVWSIMSAVRRIKVSRQRVDLQNKLLDKFSGAPELLEYLKTEAGQRLVDTDSIEVKSPFFRILLSFQFGVVLLFLGGAFLFLRNWIPSDGAIACLVLGVLLLALGLGFVASGTISYILSKHWGVLGNRESERLS